MMLVTPPLDFKNSTTKVFTFKVRGDYLQDNQPDLFELCYIDIAEGSLYVQPLAECKMPCTKDESGKWFTYSIYLTGQQYFFIFSQQNLTKSHRHPNAIQSDGGRNPIGRRTESDQTADGIRSGGVRVTVRKA